MTGMGIAFVLSRTTGLPGFKESGWELSGVVTLVLEAGFGRSRGRPHRLMDTAMPAAASRSPSAAAAAARPVRTAPSM
jgi:hypothetical protein